MKSNMCNHLKTICLVLEQELYPTCHVTVKCSLWYPAFFTLMYTGNLNFTVNWQKNIT